MAQKVRKEIVKSEYGFKKTVYHHLPSGDVVRVRSALRGAQDNYCMVTLNGRMVDSGRTFAIATRHAERIISGLTLIKES
tara:strand:- start:56 stop:295 length:240 start_codon:yes stop_codon:yes gene_type:complete